MTIRKVWAAMDSRGVTRTIQFVALVSLVLALIVGFKQQQLTTCVADYNNNYAQSVGERSAAAEADREALDDMVRAIVNARNLPPEQARQVVADALTEYVTRRDAADKQRRDNPAPPPPAQTC